MKAKSGFTLVEILIVVVILGILAAIVIPQFTSASSEAKQANLVSNLQAIRSQIQLYKIHHNDELPTAGAATFVQCLTGLTDVNGDVAAAPGQGVYGPYMQAIPKNPFSTAVDPTSVEVDGTVGGDDNGWHFITVAGTTQGLFQADDDGVNALDGDTPHSDY